MKKIAKTEELKEFIYSIDGAVRFDLYRDKYGYMQRKAIATFNQKELEILKISYKQYGKEYQRNTTH